MTTKITDGEKEAVDAFLAKHFDDSLNSLPIEEQRVADAVIGFVKQRFGSMKYILGLTVDFLIVAQRLSLVDPDAIGARLELTEESLFDRYRLVETRGGKTANTLTLTYKGASEGIRKHEENVVELFHALDRTGYPSAYVYNTGQWKKFMDQLVDCFRLSSNGRHYACKFLFHYGLEQIERNVFIGAMMQRPRVFNQLLRSYQRSSPEENGGLVLQAIAYGFTKADKPHLSIVTDKVRTGSSRQKRFGDIDCYFGLGLNQSIEVKDMAIHEVNFEHQCGSFLVNVLAMRTHGLIVAAEFSEEMRSAHRHSTSLTMLSVEDIDEIVSSWDYEKQNSALHGTLHYLAHVEANPTAVLRILKFIKNVDKSHESLRYLEQADI